MGNKTHSCQLELPKSAIIKRGDIYVASPELVFLQLANQLSFHRLVLLGLQMCCHAVGNGSTSISTKRRLHFLLSKAKWHRGHRKAEKALRFIEDGSASLMESIAFMVLTLPHSFGGFGLSGACFNHEIILDEQASKQLGQKRCFADLFYSKEKVAVEYDSFEHHHTPSAQSKDLLRASALERQGIIVIRFGTYQLYKKEACEELALNLARRMGRRIRIRSKGFDSAHSELRKLLPTNKPKGGVSHRD